MILICPSLFFQGSDLRLALRDWPLDHWHDLIRMLAGKYDFKICLITAHSELFSNYSDLVIFPKGLVELSDLIKVCDLVVTQDSGVMHLSRFYKKSVIALFGPTNPEVFATNFEHVIRLTNIACSPCHDGRSFSVNCINNICMKNISPDLVFSKIIEIASFN